MSVHVRCIAVIVTLYLGSSTLALAAPVTVRVQNVTPADGLWLTPFFLGFHAGDGDLFDPGAPVSAGFERLAEDGSTQFLADEFTAGGAGRVVGATPGGLGTFPPPALLGPGQLTTLSFDLDPVANRFLSFASMLIPSNDAFIGNDDPMAIELFDEAGTFLPSVVTILGSQVWDAGTEANTETLAAFLDQMAADAGMSTPGGVVMLHAGFNGSEDNPLGAPINILGATNGMGVFFNSGSADFSRDGYVVARISIVPEPYTGLLLAMGLGALALRRYQPAARGAR